MLFRFFIRLSYHGLHYHGWQMQKNAPSVQEELNHALSVITGNNVTVTGCGRTDTGVHAKKFFAHFDLTNPLDFAGGRNLIHKLNGILPQSIAIQELFSADPDAHARFSARSRTYEYHISKFKDPFSCTMAWHCPYKIDTGMMNIFCDELIRHHDFSSFAKTGGGSSGNLCSISEAAWSENENEIIFRISADRFLRNMVRAITGTMIDGGRGKTDLDGFRKIIESRNRSAAGTSVPAHGLHLCNVIYPADMLKPLASVAIGID